MLSTSERRITGRRVTSTLDAWIREELAEKGWSHTDFAEKLGVRLGVVSRWLTEDPCKRVVPLPQMCVQIAGLLGLNTIEVFREAGYLPMDVDGAGTPPTQFDAEVRRMQRQLARILQNAPEEQRDLVVAVAKGHLQALQATLSSLDCLTS